MSSPARCLACGVIARAVVYALVPSLLTLIERDCLGVFGGVGLLAVATDARVGESFLLGSQSKAQRQVQGSSKAKGLQLYSCSLPAHLKRPVVGREVGRRLAGRYTIFLVHVNGSSTLFRTSSEAAYALCRRQRYWDRWSGKRQAEIERW